MLAFFSKGLRALFTCQDNRLHVQVLAVFDVSA